MRRFVLVLVLMGSACFSGRERPDKAESAETTGSGTTSSTTTETATPAECGNGIVEDDEACDDGSFNGEKAACRPDCTLAVCGDGFVAPGEECDDGNTEGGDACTSACELPLTPLWTRTYTSDEGIAYAEDLALDADGNIVVVGSRGWEESSADRAWLRKYDPDGNVLWTEVHAGDPGFGLWGSGIAVDAAGNVIVVGRVQTEGQGRDLWVAKHDADGALVYTWTRDTAGWDDSGNDVVVDAAGDAYVVASIGVLGPSDDDAVVMKLDPDGAILWEHTNTGAAGWRDDARGIAVDGDGRVTVVGTEATEGAYPPGDGAIWVRRLDASGEEVWTATHQGPAGDQDWGQAVALDPAGNAIVIGLVVEVASEPGDSSPREAGIWIGKYDPDGALLWSKTHSPSRPGEHLGRGVAVRPDGSFVAVGSEDAPVAGCDCFSCPDRAWLAGYAGDGTLLWTATDVEHATSKAAAAVLDAAGNLYMAGHAAAFWRDYTGWLRKYEVTAEGRI